MIKNIVKFRKAIAIFFLLLFGLSFYLSSSVTTVYDITKFLPVNSDFIKALEVSRENFGNHSVIRMMIKDVTSLQSSTYELAIKEVEFIDSAFLADYDGDQQAALYSISFIENMTNDQSIQVVEDLRNIAPDKEIFMSGGVISSLSLQQSSSSESAKTLLLLIPIILVILGLTSTSWIEPVISLFIIIVSIVLSTGSNIIFVDGISFITKSILAALTMAIAMDYSIFLIHAFMKEKETERNAVVAMINALKSSLSTILVSALTTIAGFVALLIMQFTLGGDLGIVFAKTIAIALGTVLLFMPSILVLLDPIITKSKHKKLLPSFSKLGAFSVKNRKVILSIALLIVIPSIYGQFQNNFVYGASAINEIEGSKIYEANQEINSTFGTGNQIIILFTNDGNLTKEYEMLQDIYQIKYGDKTLVKGSSLSYAQLLGTVRFQLVFGGYIPSSTTLEMIDLAIQNPASELMVGAQEANPTFYANLVKLAASKTNFSSENFNRMFLEFDTTEEGKEIFYGLEELDGILEEYYPTQGHILGASSGAYSIKKAVEIDYIYVNLIAILSIAILIGISFKSFLVPIILLFVIQSAIFVNMAIPYLLGQSISFVGYLIISAVQLGATIDYAVLMSEKYFKARKTMNAKESGVEALKESSNSILTSGSILTFSGLAMSLMSSNALVAQIGSLIFRAGLFSILFMFFVLPGLLVMFDRFIVKKDHAKKTISST